MVRGAKTKTAVLILCALVMLLSVLSASGVIDAAAWAVSPSSRPVSRMTYHFFHANIFHALTNVWCLLSLTFFYDITMRDIIIAYIIASLYPAGYISQWMAWTLLPTVGLSALCFALMGLLFWRIHRKAYYSFFVFAIMAVGAAFPAVNTVIHLYSYLAGLFVGILFMPVR